MMIQHQSDVILYFQCLCFHSTKEMKQSTGFEIILISVVYVYVEVEVHHSWQIFLACGCAVVIFYVKKQFEIWCTVLVVIVNILHTRCYSF